MEVDAQPLGVLENPLTQIEQHVLVGSSRVLDKERLKGCGHGCAHQIGTGHEPKRSPVVFHGGRQGLVDTHCDEGWARHAQSLRDGDRNKADT